MQIILEEFRQRHCLGCYKDCLIKEDVKECLNAYKDFCNDYLEEVLNESKNK